MEKVFILKGLDCPNCAAKIEHEVASLHEVTSATVNLMKQTLTISVDASAGANVAKQIETIVHKHEPDVQVSEKVATEITRVYLLKGLDCPNCSAKIEKEVGDLDGVSSSAVNLMKQTLTVSVDASAAANVANQIEIIVHKHEPDVEVSEYATEIAPKEKAKAVKDDEDDSKRMTVRLIAGAVIFAVGIFLGEFMKASLPVQLIFMVTAYSTP